MWFRPWELSRWFGHHGTMLGTKGSLEYWLGTIQHVPHHYYLVALLVTTPLLTLLSFFWAEYGFIKKHRKNIHLLGLSLMVWVPLLLLSFTLRQGLSHYLQALLPPLCLLAAWGLWQFHQFLKERWFHGKKHPSLLLIWIVPVLMEVAACYITRPFFFEYFNVLVGGPAGVTRNKTFSQGIYGEAILPLFELGKKHAPSGSTVLCRLGAWPGLSHLSEYLGPGYPLQGEQAVDPLGPRLVLRCGAERDNVFYRYEPDERFYEKIADVDIAGGSLGDVWLRKQDEAAHQGLLYFDDFSSRQIAYFIKENQNLNLNPFSDGKLFGIKPREIAAARLVLPAQILGNSSEVWFELDLRMKNGVLELQGASAARPVATLGHTSGFQGRWVSAPLKRKEGEELQVILKWTSTYPWNGQADDFWESDWIDAIRIYRKLPAQK